MNDQLYVFERNNKKFLAVCKYKSWVVVSLEKSVEYYYTNTNNFNSLVDIYDKTLTSVDSLHYVTISYIATLHACELLELSKLASLARRSLRS